MSILQNYRTLLAREQANKLPIPPYWFKNFGVTASMLESSTVASAAERKIYRDVKLAQWKEYYRSDAVDPQKKDIAQLLRTAGISLH